MKINILSKQDASRIAAGEVIERPAAALRELLDNAIDSGASEIAVYLEQGGIKSIEVIDNGEGITRPDLERAIMPHATSKIKTIYDLQSIYSLGFRGEALASMAACSYLQIRSRVKGSDGYLLRSDGQNIAIEPTAFSYGTAVKVSDIFYNLTARRRFLKSAGIETTECQKVFFEKALAFPQLSFSFTIDGRQKFNYKAATVLERTVQIYGRELGIKANYLSNNHLLDIDGFELQLVTATAGLYRGDRRYMHIYINGRRIMEYSLLQAIHYAYSSLLVAGQFPIVFAFIKVRADLADFNIHPAKREAKLHNLDKIHKALVNKINNLHQPGSISNYKDEAHPSTPHLNFNLTTLLVPSPIAQGVADSPVLTAAKKEEPLSFTAAWRYLGQLMGVFLLVEWEDNLYLIDQHAAHERVLYDELIASPPPNEALLNPIKIYLTDDELTLFKLKQDEIAELAIRLQLIDNYLLILAAPNQFNEELCRYWLNNNLSLKRELYARLACRAAIKEGEYLEPAAALKLIEQTFALPEPYCPHGRPVWIELEREQLYKLIKRIV
ncbi:MAG: DNA mismatch repair endonuclease MutL [Spirochaetaceae bacterium]|nr:DNA mismatch repair endonuclease MutL [Spirochaetaceae bacterium]